MVLAEIMYSFPVFGFLPGRAFFFSKEKLPKPLSFTSSPLRLRRHSPQISAQRAPKQKRQKTKKKKHQTTISETIVFVRFRASDASKNKALLRKYIDVFVFEPTPQKTIAETIIFARFQGGPEKA